MKFTKGCFFRFLHKRTCINQKGEYNCFDVVSHYDMSQGISFSHITFEKFLEKTEEKDVISSFSSLLVTGKGLHLLTSVHVPFSCKLEVWF